MPFVIGVGAGGAQEKFTQLQLELLAVEIISIAHMARVVDQAGQHRVTFNKILQAKIFTRFVGRISLGHAINGSDIGRHFVVGQGILNLDQPHFVKSRPLFMGEAGRGETIVVHSASWLSGK
jgi:hypothetical protein